MRNLLIFTLLLSGCAHGPYSQRQVCHSLKRMYLEDNKNHFDGTLPTKIHVGCQVLDSQFEALTREYDKGKFEILINSRYDHFEPEVRMTLIHEECHLATWHIGGDHPPEWGACYDKVVRAYIIKGETK